MTLELLRSSSGVDEQAGSGSSGCGDKRIHKPVAEHRKAMHVERLAPRWGLALGCPCGECLTGPRIALSLSARSEYPGSARHDPITSIMLAGQDAGDPSHSAPCLGIDAENVWDALKRPSEVA